MSAGGSPESERRFSIKLRKTVLLFTSAQTKNYDNKAQKSPATKATLFFTPNPQQQKETNSASRALYRI